MKEAFKLAAIINIVIAILSYSVFNSLFYSLLLIVLSLIYFSYLEKEELNKSKVIFLSLINLFLNPLSGIILLVSTDKITNDVSKSVNVEKNKIELPLNFGVGLLSLSGIILATSNWEIINSITKIILLFVIGLIFIVLSRILEVKLNIRDLSKKYYIIGNVFLLLSVVANGYLDVTSHWFSFNGGGKNLYIAFTSIVISLFSQILYKKYNDEMYKYLTYIGIIVSMLFILLQLKISFELILIVVNVILFIVHLRNSDSFSEYAKYLTYVFGLLSIFVISDSVSITWSIVLGFSSAINLFVISLKNGILDGILGSILINILTLLTVSLLDFDEQILSLIVVGVYSIYYLLNMVGSNKTFKLLMCIFSNIVFIFCLIIGVDNSMFLILMSFLITLTSIIVYFKKSVDYEKLLLPIKIIVFIFSFISLLDSSLLDFNYILIALYLISFLIYLKATGKVKLMGKVGFYAILFLSIIANDLYIVPSVIGIISAFLFYFVDRNKFSYIVLLFTILMSFTYTNILNTTILVSSTLLLFVFILLTLFTLDNKKINIVNYLAIILPFSLITTDSNCIYELREIIFNLIGMYLVLLINIFLVKSDKERNIIGTLLTCFLIIRVIFIESWMVGLYVGIFGLIMIVFGMIKKDYKGLYFEGFVITIINLIYHFKNIFTIIPLWGYLFLSGVVIISIVTYKAIKDNDGR